MTDLPNFLDRLPLARDALEYAAGQHAAPCILHPLVEQLRVALYDDS